MMDNDAPASGSPVVIHVVCAEEDIGWIEACVRRATSRDTFIDFSQSKVSWDAEGRRQAAQQAAQAGE